MRSRGLSAINKNLELKRPRHLRSRDVAYINIYIYIHLFIYQKHFVVLLAATAVSIHIIHLIATSGLHIAILIEFHTHQNSGLEYRTVHCTTNTSDKLILAFIQESAVEARIPENC